MAVHTFTAGEVLTAANTIKYLYAGYHSLRLRRAANQSISNNTVTNISWDTEDADVDGFIAVTATDITIPSGMGGLYAFSIDANFSGVTGTLGSYVDFNNTTRSVIYRNNGDNGASDDKMSCSGVMLCNAADVIRCRVFQTSGGSLNLTARLEMWLLGAQ